MLFLRALAITILCAIAMFEQGVALPLRRPLWRGCRFTHIQRQEAIQRGLQFIYASAQDPDNFAEYGDDYLWCFYTIASTSADPDLRQLAWRMGRERARQWRRDHPHVPEGADASQLISLLCGSYASDCLGLKDPSMKNEIATAVSRMRPSDFLGFDPAREGVPGDLPKRCASCGGGNYRGATACRNCGGRLAMISRFEVLLDSLIVTYFGERYGVRLGGSFPEFIRWLPQMHPYPSRNGDSDAFREAAYAATHVVYTLNDYGQWRLKPEWLPHEYAFLKTRLEENIHYGDPETLGEFLDTLKSFGLDESDPSIRVGTAYLLSAQNPDGSWGDSGSRDVYQRYHSTWTAIDGLRDYAWQGQRTSFPEVLRSLMSRR